MTVGVYANGERDIGYVYTRTIVAFLLTRGVQPALQAQAAAAAGWPEWAATDKELFQNAAFAVVLGGDGTMLQASHLAAPYGTPLLGINLGHLGFLTDAERENGLTALDLALRRASRMESRLMLSVDGAGVYDLPLNDRLALNDVCFSRGVSGKLAVLCLSINGAHAGVLRADGLVISTPTGSTAYNMSAGGPVLASDGNFYVLTPVCPHALSVRPWVLGADDTVDVRVAEAARCPVDVALDGEMRLTLGRGEGLRVGRAPCTAGILRTKNTRFFDILREKVPSYENETSGEDR